MSSHSGKRTKKEAYSMARNEKINLSFYTRTAFLLFPKLW